MLGIGKAEQDDQMLDETAAKRRLLESEVEETEELRQKRLVCADDDPVPPGGQRLFMLTRLRARAQAKAAKEDTIRKDVADILKPFHCELCSKQYKMASEYEAHLSSYDHNHKKVLRGRKGGRVGREAEAEDRDGGGCRGRRAGRVAAGNGDGWGGSPREASGT